MFSQGNITSKLIVDVTVSIKNGSDLNAAIKSKFNNMTIIFDGSRNNDKVSYIDIDGDESYNVINNDLSKTQIKIKDFIYSKSIPAAPLMQIYRIQEGLLNGAFLIDVLMLGDDLQHGILKTIKSTTVQYKRIYS